MRTLWIVLLLAMPAFSQAIYTDNQSAMSFAFIYGKQDRYVKYGVRAFYSINDIVDVAYSHQSLSTDKIESYRENEYMMRFYIPFGKQFAFSLGGGHNNQKSTERIFSYLFYANSKAYFFEAGFNFILKNIPQNRITLSVYYRPVTYNTDIVFDGRPLTLRETLRVTANSFIVESGYAFHMDPISLVLTPAVKMDVYQQQAQIFYGLNAGFIIRH